MCDNKSQLNIRIMVILGRMKVKLKSMIPGEALTHAGQHSGGNDRRQGGWQMVEHLKE